MIDASDPATVRGLHDRMALVLGLALMGRRWSWSPWNWTTSPRPRTGWRCAGRPRPTRTPAEWSSRSQGPGQHADTDPVRLLRAWRALLAEHGIDSGRLLRSATRHDRLGASRRRCRPSVRRQGARRAAPRRHLERALAARPGHHGPLPRGCPGEHDLADGRWSPGSPVVLSSVRAVDQWKNNALAGVGL